MVGQSCLNNGNSFPFVTVGFLFYSEKVFCITFSEFDFYLTYNLK